MIFQWNDFLTLVEVKLQHNFEPKICFTFKYFLKVAVGLRVKTT